MPEKDPPAVANGDASPQTLSQLAARVLNQLALSAWLPSAALVLALDFVFHLGSALDEPGLVGNPLGVAAAKLGDTSIGGAILLIAAIIVLTVVTQAFSFEIIQLVEGYWGTSRPIEWLACRRRKRFVTKKERLDASYAFLTERAWNVARTNLEERQRKACASGFPPGSPEAPWTPNVLEIIAARLKVEEPSIKPSDDERALSRRIDWRAYSDGELLRRRTNIDRKLKDYPVPIRMLPTRVGNILRAHEDATRDPEVQSLVQRVFDQLPRSLQVEHDEQRTKLDLYCSMVFVVLCSTGVAAVRLYGFGAWWVGGPIAVGVVAAWMMYRGAVATARAYGGLLALVADPASVSQ